MQGFHETPGFPPFSDIDLLILPTPSSSLTSSELSKIREDIEESRFPLKVDLVYSEDLVESYRARIDREKIEI